MKEVRFDLYCKNCKHYEKDEGEEPCCDCLTQGGRENSDRPLYFDGVMDDSRTKQSSE